MQHTKFVLTIYFVYKAPGQPEAVSSRVFKKSKVVCGILTAWGRSRVMCVKALGKLLDVYYILVPSPEDTAKNRNRFLPSYVLRF